MFSPRVLIAIVAFASATLAAPKLGIKDIAGDGDNSTCWIGNIGEPCYGHGNGCSLTGALLACAQPSTGIDEMIFYDACYPPDIMARNAKSHGTCRCLTGTGQSSCAT